MAGSIAASYGDKGAIIVSVGDDGTRIGVAGLSWRDALDALCQAIHNEIERAHSEGEPD